MRWVTVLLATLLVLLQWPMWFGERGWFAVQRLENSLDQQQAANAQVAQRNAQLDAEVRDLRTGVRGVEDQARREMGMVKPDEIFVQIVPPAHGASRPAPASSAPAAGG
jgi:cell division protein FtsB